MCRWVLYQGDEITLASLVTEPAHSIIKQSVHAAETEEPLNGDGFGLAWYVPAISDRPGLFRSVTPAWSNQNLLEMARVTRSPCILAHVRAATSGLPVAETNCHPFTSGRYAFMHNGDIARFHQIRRWLLADLSDAAFTAIKGSTDSEHLFGVFLDEAAEGDLQNAPDRAAALANALERALSRVVALSDRAKASLPRPTGVAQDEDFCYLNCAVTDGVCSAACRFTTDRDEPSSLYVHADVRRVIVASERLTPESGWQQVPRDSLVIVREDRSVKVRPMRLQGVNLRDAA